ncbi:hypothetical protein BV394_06830 [Brevirhabdus pacifica]|uniref:Uncharacterized protein n=1 Tax=Brevirhabdus pacifica TaxID=1267768 RepID=A0A1U7DHI7_9RHOB|nr:tripartite tricarboxylate transporter TctB family protein [Brevirhabdus pacifica]APX89464.1 hypothetical protein BV394_06830 [Brevirhabdus pacifica]PJJ85888.1 tripartite tricarboxylate transporter TctB family protein [Brevirhabdus pacifica]
MTFDSRILTTLVVFALFAGAALMALALPQKAAFMPLLIAVPGALLAGAQLLLDIRDMRREASDPDATRRAHRERVAEDGGRSEGVMFLWLGIFTALLLGAGFIVGGPLAVFLYVGFERRRNWRNATIAGLATLAVLYGIFIQLLELSLFPGLLLPGLSL